MGGRGAEFGFWQALGAATGVRDDARPVDFATLERRSSPNDALACPAGFCPKASADIAPPVFPAPPHELLKTVRDVVLAEPRTDELYVGPEEGRLRFVQRSFLMRYPDVIDVRVISAGDGATLALYSRSLVGRSDLGVNRARIARWLDALTKRLPARP